MDGKTCPFIGLFGGGFLYMHEDTKSYPPVCIGWDLACLLCGNPDD